MRSDGGHCHRSRPTDRCLRRSSRILTRRWRTDPRNRTPRNAIRSREGSAPAGAAADVPLAAAPAGQADGRGGAARSEEHTSELQSPCKLVCSLLLEKKKEKSSTRRLAT